MIDNIHVNGFTFKVGQKVRLKEDEEIGIIEEIQYSGHFEDFRKYDLMIYWLDDDRLIRTPTEHFFEEMEFTV